MRQGSRAVLITGLAAGILIIGWSTFDFVCDDAYIAFRYCENLLEGHGLVWNREPFRPVEGYTSLLWVLICSGIWAGTGLEPPVFVNWLLLACGIGSLGLTARLIWRLPWRAEMGPLRLVWIGLVLGAAVSNRTFIAWTTSGLEQGLFTLLLLGFVSVALEVRSPARLLGLGALAALMALTRPDGLLFCAAFAAMTAVWIWRRGLADGWVALPLFVPMAHVAWRLQTYGFPLPNTYYAKVREPWPDAGLLYLLSFCFEYAYLLMLPLVALWLWRSAPHLRVPTLETAIGWGALATIIGHALYYVLIVGGDHFEYRIFHHLVPLLGIAFLWMGDRAELSPRAVVSWFIGMTALGLVMPWAHWLETKDLTERHAKDMPFVHLTEAVPTPIRPWAMAFDALQNSLISRTICIRHQSHKVFAEHVQPARTGPRQRYDPGDGDIPVFSTGFIGLPGWTMPDVAIIDQKGLVDLVVARSSLGHRRFMAHDRVPPKGYVRCFRPNVKTHGGVVRIHTRKNPLTKAEVRACETRFLSP